MKEINLEEPLVIVKHSSDIVRRAFSYIAKNNPSNNAPYHNLNHLLTVFRRCFEGACYHKIGKRDELLVAALFHDADHSKGEHKDNTNILLAIDFFQEWVKDSDLNAKLDCEKVELLIKETLYPPEGPPMFLEGAIIRDADMMQILDDGWINTVLYGLAEESKCSPLEMLEKQVDFHKKTLKVYSGWGQTIHLNEWEKVNEKINILRNAL